MPLLNYTTQISAGKTTGEILTMLARAGAVSVKTDYEAGEAVAVEFLLNTPYGRQGYRLPVNVDAVYATIQKQAKQGKITPRYATREQAARIGWRIVKDWLQAQLAIVETEMVALDQVMFPYMLSKGNQTVYQLFKEDRLTLTEGSSHDHQDG